MSGFTGISHHNKFCGFTSIISCTAPNFLPVKFLVQGADGLAEAAGSFGFEEHVVAVDPPNSGEHGGGGAQESEPGGPRASRGGEGAEFFQEKVPGPNPRAAAAASRRLASKRSRASRGRGDSRPPRVPGIPSHRTRRSRVPGRK